MDGHGHGMGKGDRGTARRSSSPWRSAAWLLAVGLALGVLAAPAPARARDMTLVTLNLHHDRDDWPGRREYIADELQALQPDVVALQEVLEHEDLPNQAAWLAGRLGYDYEFTSVDPVGAPKRYGNALLTRRPVLMRRQRWLQPLDDYRMAAQLRIDIDGQPVNVYVTHLNERADGQGRRIRTRQVADLLRFVAETADQEPVVIAGDFNSTADADDLQALRSGYGDGYGSVHRDSRDGTLNMEIYRKPARIDHVFFQQRRLLAREARIIFTQPDARGRWASDHYGVWTRLQFASDEGSPPADAGR